LVGTDKDKIYEEATKLLRNAKEYDKMSKAVNPYGDGKASERICEGILNYFNKSHSEVEEFQG
jgi:UDP-N-acetylglucosamine 2-epimerase (non-hydrolysing)